MRLAGRWHGNMRSPPIKKRETGLFKEVWRAYNDLIDFARELAVSPNSRGISVSRTSNGTLLRIEPDKGVPNLMVKRMRVEAVHNDYIVCREWDGVTLGQSFSVAKPFRLRRTPFDGVAITYDDGTVISYQYSSSFQRVATSGALVETQVITPEFNIGFDEIHALKLEDETGVAGADWLDLNTDGRAWAQI